MFYVSHSNAYHSSFNQISFNSVPSKVTFLHKLQKNNLKPFYIFISSVNLIHFHNLSLLYAYILPYYPFCSLARSLVNLNGRLRSLAPVLASLFIEAYTLTNRPLFMQYLNILHKSRIIIIALYL